MTTEEFDMSGMEEGEIAEVIVKKMLECENCGYENSGAEEVNHGIIGGALMIHMKYHCENCGKFNDPVGEVE